MLSLRHRAAFGIYHDVMLHFLTPPQMSLYLPAWLQMSLFLPALPMTSLHLSALLLTSLLPHALLCTPPPAVLSTSFNQIVPKVPNSWCYQTQRKVALTVWSAQTHGLSTSPEWQLQWSPSSASRAQKHVPWIWSKNLASQHKVVPALRLPQSPGQIIINKPSYFVCSPNEMFYLNPALLRVPLGYVTTLSLLPLLPVFSDSWWFRVQLIWCKLLM